MKRTEIIRLVLIALCAAIFSLVISGMLFNSPSKHTAKVPDVKPISSSFPDVHNDPNYSTFLNSNALDPTLPINIGGSQNTSPFSGQ